VSDDTDKAAWEYAEKHFGTAGGLHWRGPIVEAFKAGASHERSRPLSEDETMRLYSALQRMRTKG
jgi:hypothetical protein